MPVTAHQHRLPGPSRAARVGLLEVPALPAARSTTLSTGLSTGSAGRSLGRPPVRLETGMVTSEYATGAVGAACIGCVLWVLATGGFLQQLIEQILAVVGALAVLLPAIPAPPFPALPPILL